MKRKIKQVWILLKSVSVSVAFLLVINLATFLLGLIFYGLNETWEFHLTHCVFSLNGRMIGLMIFEPASIGLMLVVFIAAFANELKGPH